MEITYEEYTVLHLEINLSWPRKNDVINSCHLSRAVTGQRSTVIDVPIFVC